MEQIGVVADGGVTGQSNFSAFGSNLVKISGCIVVLVNEGYAIVQVGFKRRVFRKGMMAVLFYDDTFWIERSSRSFMCNYVAISYENIEEVIYKLSSSYFWETLTDNPLFMPSANNWQHLLGWYAQIQWACNNLAKEYLNTMLRNNFHNLFMAMDSEISYEGEVGKKPISRSWVLIIRFLKLLTQNCRQTREVSFYAEKLCITTSYLYKLTRQRLNLSPKELVDRQTICEIKTLLSSTDMSVKEIADALNFDDVPYMCRYFRRHTEVSPLEYRNDIKRS